MGISQKELAKALSEVLKASNAHPTLPILAGVVLEVKAGNLSLTCTDLEQFLTVKRPAPGLQDGKVIIKGKEALNLLKTFPAGDVDLEFEPEVKNDGGFVTSKAAVTFRQGRINSRVKTEFQNDDFPTVPVLKNPVQFWTTPAVLTECVNHTKAAVSTEMERRPNLSGIYFASENGKLTAATTDGTRLSIYRTDAPAPDGIKFILPLKPAEILPGLFKSDAEIVISIGKYATFESGDKIFTVQLIDGEFPDYKSVLPDFKEFPRVELPKKENTAALKRIETLVSKGKNYVMLDIAGNVLTLAGEFDGTTISETLDVKFPWPDVKFDFNPGYLMDGIKSVDGESFTLYLNPDVEKPSVITTPDGLNKYTYLIMPMRVDRPLSEGEKARTAAEEQTENEDEQSRTETEEATGTPEPGTESAPITETISQEAVPVPEGYQRVDGDGRNGYIDVPIINISI